MATRPKMCNHSIPITTSHPPIYEYNMLDFRGYSPIWSFTFTLTMKFHSSPIGYHDFSVMNDMNIAVCFFFYLTMNEIMDTSTIY
jgi:hypothetical protein